MLYENLIDWRIYPPQSKITFPKKDMRENKDDDHQKVGKLGYGNMIFMLTPNMETTFSLISNPNIAIRESLYKHYIVDSIYKGKIGQKVLMLNETQKVKKMIPKKFELNYVARTSIKPILNKEKNCIVDLGRWMELFFTYYLKTNPKARCEAFINFLASKIYDTNYERYNKILFIDVLSWVDNAKTCTVMNPKLLNNPLSILVYGMYKYPHLLEALKDIRIYLINSSSKQIFLFNNKDLNKEIYPKFKARLKLFKNVNISEEEENSDISNKEIISKAYKPKTKEEIQEEIKAEAKNEIISRVRYNLVGPKEEAKSMNDDFDYDSDNYDFLDDSDFDITDELELEKEEVSDNEEEILDEEEIKDIEKRLQNGDDPETIIERVTNDARAKRYALGFKPTRTPEQESKVHRMMDIQNMSLSSTSIDKAKSKLVDKTDFTDFFKTTNPHIQSSNFVNLDKNYNEKKLEADIDNSVACLNNASKKIFITNKEEIDSSDSMNLKRTLKYSLQDEDGNRMTLTFDVPIIIDDNYIFVNGTKKVIGKQFILKPLSKTGPDTVQLVTHYNKSFIMRDGRIDQITKNIINHINKNNEKFRPGGGNSAIKNEKHNVSLDFGLFSKAFTHFKYKNYEFIMEVDACIDKYNKKYPNSKVNYDSNIEFPIGINHDTKELIIQKSTDSFSNFLISIFDEEDKKAISKMTGKPNLLYARIKLMQKVFPLIIIMLYCEGFENIMRKAEIDYQFIDPKVLRSVDKLKYDYLPLHDKILIWERKNLATMLLMNGMKKFDFSIYTADQLNDKNTYRALVENHYGNSSINYKLDQFYDFTLDGVTIEILEDMGYPTDLMELLLLGVNLLCDNKYLPENNMSIMRIRSNEVIANIVYKKISDAYVEYRKTSHKKKPASVSIKQSAIIDTLISEDTNLLEEFSVINPVLEIEKARSVTYKGLRGIQLDRAITLPKRAYDPSMLGILGISTPPDANTGITRQLSLEPKITSTRGYLDAGSKEDVDNLTSANLLTPSELLTPLGVIHDDPDRTAMTYKQTKYMIPIEKSSPVMIGNKVESLMPYLLSNEFVVDAKEDGKVIEIAEDYVVVQYKSGKNYAIDISNRVRKNAQAGFFIENKLTCDLKLGEKFKRGDVLAYNNKAFTKNPYDRGASMNLGVLTKVAVLPTWDCYEDSAPISSKLANDLATEMVWEKAVTLEPKTYIEKIAKVGDKIDTGDSLMIFEQTEDADFASILDNIRDDLHEEVIESTKSRIVSKYSGEVVDVKVYTTVELDELSDSLAKITKAYHNKVNRRNKILDKYKNEGDINYYKCGQILEEEDKVMKPSSNGKIKGEYVDEGVIIVFYIKYRDIAAKGDKVCAQFALKGVSAHVLPPGREPRSEFRPDEEIGTMISPLAISARKTPTIFLTMYTNKLLIEEKRFLKNYYLNN